MRALLLLLFVPALAFAQAGGPPFIPVNMMKVAATPMSNTVNAVGALIAEDSVMLRPEIDGRIDRLLFKEGQPVRKGAVLVVLDSAEQRARLGKSECGNEQQEEQGAHDGFRKNNNDVREARTLSVPGGNKNCASGSIEIRICKDCAGNPTVPMCHFQQGLSHADTPERRHPRI